MFNMCSTSFPMPLLIKRGRIQCHPSFTSSQLTAVIIHVSTADSIQSAIRTNIATPESVPWLITKTFTAVCWEAVTDSLLGTPQALGLYPDQVPCVCGALCVSVSYPGSSEGEIVMMPQFDRAKELHYCKKQRNERALIGMGLVMLRTLMPQTCRKSQSFSQECGSYFPHSLRTITEIKQCMHRSTAKLSFVKFWYLSSCHADKTPDIQTHFLRFSFLLLF